MHSKELLKIQFAQLANSWAKTKNNVYSDKQKKSYSDTLEKLFVKLNCECIDDLKIDDLKVFQKVIDFFNTSITYLNDSTFNQTPNEVIDCLMLALKDWISEPFIISTSFTNENKRYYFKRDLLTSIYDLIEAKYDIRFNVKLIQIGIPRLLVRDYFFNAVMYHELGHFVDQQYQISLRLARVLAAKTQEKSNDILLFQEYLPVLNEIVNNDSFEFEILKRYLGEYFADVFAAQYVGNSLNHYLSHIDSLASSSHPSCENRIRLVDSFLEEDNSPFLNFINESVEKTTQKTLLISHEIPDCEDVFEFLPLEIKNDKQIHGLFPMIYRVFYNYKNEFEVKNSISFHFESKQIYGILNNLVEKSIANYFIKKNWSKANKKHMNK